MAIPKFMCDEMLKGLARWLRAAGYDTALPDPGTADRAVLQRARFEQRILLSRDRKLLEFRDARPWVRLLPQSSVAGWVCSLNRWYGLNWEWQPFSRCLRCNTPLVDADAGLRTGLPERSRGMAGTPRWCGQCRQLFWEGSHVRRMRERLASWNRTCRS